jgi:hypothetical protein
MGLPSMNRTQFGSYAFLTVSGISSAVSTTIGLLMAAFGYTKSAHSMADLLFWLLPSISLVAFGLALIARTTGKIVAWLLYAGSLTTVCWINWQQCLQGQCDTSSLMQVCLSTALRVPHLWVLFLAALSLQLIPRSARPSKTAPSLKSAG